MHIKRESRNATVALCTVPCGVVYFVLIRFAEICVLTLTRYFRRPVFVQASTIDGRRKGACLFCQEYFMDLYLLAELKTISLKVSEYEFHRI